MLLPEKQTAEAYRPTKKNNAEHRKSNYCHFLFKRGNITWTEAIVNVLSQIAMNYY